MKKLALRVLLLSAIVAIPASVAQAQTNSWIYHLNNSLAEENGGPSLVANGGILSAVGYTFGANQGLELSGIWGSGAASYTIVMHYSLQDLSGFAKVIDFKNESASCWQFGYSDCGFYNGNWTGPGQAVFYPTAHGFNDLYSENTMATTVFSRDGSGTIRVYVNGVKDYTDGDNAHQNAVFTSDIARFFEDGGTKASGGFIDYLAIYDTTFSDSEAEALGETVVTTPEPASLVLVASGLVVIGGVARRRRKNTRAA
ncbi:MAG: hypothetical protein JWM95_905 [Gemmatimonadetes bacterium]|nr:hypothetical protein [Gemmatimonadota bacterium]